MNPEQLIEFIRRQLATGKTRAEVEQILRINNVSANEMDIAFNAAEWQMNQNLPVPHFPPTRHYGMIWLTVILALILLVSGAGAYLVLFQPERASELLGITLPEPAPLTAPVTLPAITAPVATSTSTSTDTSGWKTYRNEEESWEISLPQNWEVFGDVKRGELLTKIFDNVSVNSLKTDATGYASLDINAPEQKSSNLSIRQTVETLSQPQYDDNLGIEVRPLSNITEEQITNWGSVVKAKALNFEGCPKYSYWLSNNLKFVRINVVKCFEGGQKFSILNVPANIKSGLESEIKKILSTFRFTTNTSDQKSNNPPFLEPPPNDTAIAASIVARLSSLRAEAELAYSDKLGYSGVCSSQKILKMFAEIEKINPFANPTCKVSKDGQKYIMTSSLANGSGTNFCIDNTGTAKELPTQSLAVMPANSFTCPSN